MKKLLKNFIEVGPYCYRLEDKIGEGSSSNVYKGYLSSLLISHSSHHECYAIKQIKFSNQVNMPDIHQQLKILMMFREQQGIIKLLDVIYENNNIYIITQLCEGGTLKNLIAQKGAMPQEVALEYFKQLFNAYEAIFKKNIIHRDIKPANILLKNNQIKIADFGFAATAQQVSQEKLRVGSPLFMPYETLKYNIYSYKGDIWAMGIILYQLLTGETPFKSNKLDDLINQIQHFQIRSKMPSSVSPSTINLLQKLLKVDSKERISLISLKNLLFKTPEEKKKNSPTKTGVYSSERSKVSQKISPIKNSTPKIKNPSFLDNPQKCKPLQVMNQKQKQEQQTSQIYLPKINNKKILDKLLSQIQLARFTFKLWQLMRENKQFSYNWILKNYLVGLIFMKLQETQKLVLLSQYQSACFNSSPQYQMLLQYCRSYRKKYSELTVSKISQSPSIEKIIKILPTELIKINTKIKQQELPNKVKLNAIRSLDLLITLYQLLNLLARKGLQEFQQISQIDKIANAGSFCDVNEKHFQLIQKKLGSLKII